MSRWRWSSQSRWAARGRVSSRSTSGLSRRTESHRLTGSYLPATGYLGPNGSGEDALNRFTLLWEDRIQIATRA